MSRAAAILAAAFAPERGRTPRSAAYKAGALAALEHRLEGRRLECTYEVGTAEADAWFAGVDEGAALARAEREAAAV